MEKGKDPIGRAVLDYTASGKSIDIIVKSDICEDDVIPSEYLFRKFDDMPVIEQKALERCSGKVLDIGAAAGVHAEHLIAKGHTVRCIDISAGSIAYLHSKKIPSEQVNFLEYTADSYDTLLFLMNGIGIAGKLENLDALLMHAKKILNPGGKIIFDSTDIKYLYENEDGSIWIDLAGSYYGNVQFQMEYKDQQSDWFDWLYVDFDNLAAVSQKCGLNAQMIYREGDSYLAELSVSE